MNPGISVPSAIEAALQDSEARFRAAVEYAPVPIMLHTLDGEIVAVNRAFTSLTGYTHAEVTSGRDWFMKGHRVPEEQVDELLQNIHEQMRTGAIAPQEMPVWTKWGERREWLFHGSRPVALPDGRLAVVSTAVDITESRRADKALRASQARFERATRAARELIYEYDLASGKVWRSSGMAEVIGIRPEEAEPTVDWWRARIHPDDLRRLEEGFAEVQASGAQRAPQQYRVRNAQGEYVWVEDRALVVRDAAGTVTCLVGSTANIEERRRMEAEMAASLAKAQQSAALADELRERVERQARLFDTALSSIHDYVYIFDLEGRIVYANKLLLELWGVSAEQAQGKTLAELAYPADVEAQLMEDLRTVVATARATTSVTHYTSPSGVQATYENVLAPVFDASGRVAMVAGASRDVTERNKMEGALKEADRRKDEFIATLAHELRNPLAPIRNSIELLRHAPVHSALSHQAVDVIERHVRQLTRLVDDLLDVSRIGKGKITLRRQPVLLADIVARAVESVRPLIDSRRHRLDLSLPPQPLWLEGDETRLIQVLVNMLNNAAKYTDPGGRIELAAETAGAAVTLRLKDNGMGMTSQILRHAFDMFAQADHSLDRAQGGLGIGLTLVKSLVEMHGGTVEASSAGPGQGSEFVLRLPLIAPPQGAAPQAPEAAAPARPLRILVVDDNVDSAASMAMLLQFQGHETETADDGPAAIEAALAFRPDVLLLDIGLPTMDGYEVARRLRALPQTRDAVLIALTGYGQAEDRRRSQEAGFDHHLVKPVEPESVSRILASCAPGRPRNGGGKPAAQ